MARHTLSDWSRRTFLGAGFGLAVAPALLARRQGQITIFAAASLKPALDEIAGAWPSPIALSYGGSGTLARQVALGAPVDIVLLAASDWMDWLSGQVPFASAPRPITTNRLVLAGAADMRPVPLTSTELVERLGPAGRFAMGDPLSVPAGRYGQQALETLGLWTALQPRMLLAENVRAALAYVARGDVTLGLVYGSDLLGAEVAEIAAIPGSAHQPIVYPGAALASAGPEATAFLEHLSTQHSTFARYGFTA